MTKHYDSMETAIQEYTKHTGDVPTLREIEELYHRYRNDWKNFNGFIDWLNYNT